MRVKSALMASAAVLMLASTAPAEASGFYITALGGANFLEGTDGRFTNLGLNGTSLVAHFDPDTGFLIGGAVGLDLDAWLQGLKAELEMSYRRNDVGGRWSLTNNLSLNALAFTSGDISANASTFALMANIWYEFNIGSRFKPYVGGGAGWARSSVDGRFIRDGEVAPLVNNNLFGGFSLESSGFAYQLGAGITSEVMPGVSLGLGYRFFDGPNNELFFGGKSLSIGRTIKFDDINQSVALSLTIDVN
jgi:opacity protein-like surface antigen